MIDKLPLVELSVPPIVYCSGLASAEIIGSEVHYIFYRTQHESLEVGARLVRVVNLHLVMQLANSVASLRAVATTLGLSMYG